MRINGPHNINPMFSCPGSVLQKMVRLTVFLLFLSCVFCLATAQTHHTYSQMEPGLKRFVDMAVNRANQQFNGVGHLNFEAIGDGAQVTLLYA